MIACCKRAARCRAARGRIARLALLLPVLAAALCAGEEASVPSSDPERFMPAGGAVYFIADDGTHGRELWTTDGTEPGTRLVSDLEPGAAGSDIQMEPESTVNGAFLFTARTKQQNWALYRTDGTPDGTRPLCGFAPVVPMKAAPLAMVRGRLFLNVVSKNGDSSLWVSDGTEGGTHPLGQIPAATNFTSFTATDGGVLFLADHAGDSLYQTDGTQEGTFKRPETFVHPNRLAALGDRVVFICDGKRGGTDLCVMDPSPDSTRIVRHVSQEDGGGPTGNFARLGGTLLFDCGDAKRGKELWRTDGTPEGTGLLKDINPDSPGSDPYSFMVSGNRCFFSAFTAEFGRELWVTDGTAGGTSVVRDVLPGYRSAEPYALRAEGGRLFFSAADGVSGEELWVSDGSEAGTRRVADLWPGPSDASPHGTTAMNGFVVFAATEPDHGRELWRSDGTEAGTRLVKDINTRRQTNPSASPRELTPVGALLFFAANDLEHGTELWTTDGSETGTRLVRDICPGTPGSNPHYLTPFNGLLYFSADDGNLGDELWCSDGTEAGTRMVADINFREQSAAPRELAPDRQKFLYFVAYAGPEKGNCIFAVNAAGGVEGAAQTDHRPPAWNPRNLRVWNGWLYFTADDGVHGEELWRTNLAETAMVKDIVSVPLLGALPRGLTATPDALYFAANDGVHGEEPWRLNTRGEARIVCDVSPPENALPFLR